MDKKVQIQQNGRLTLYLHEVQEDGSPGEARVGHKARNSKVAASSSVLAFWR